MKEKAVIAKTSKSTRGRKATNGVNASSAEQTKKSGDSIRTVFEEELKDIYGAEKQLLKALPEMAEAADSEELKTAFEEHLEQTRQHAKRIEQVFALLGIDREDKKCKAMEGLIEEGKEIIKTYDKGPVRDCALIIGAQKVEHYEIAAYGSLCELAEVMGRHKAADLLDANLEEEEQTDVLLTSIAEGVNDMALSGDEPSFSGNGKSNVLSPAGEEVSMHSLV